MSSIRAKDTKIELAVRKALWARGKRYRIHNKRICGIPDISNTSKKISVFIDGCFWHGCDSCYKEPKTNTKFWRDKIKRNKARRRQVLDKLLNDGWNVLEFWEHEINKDPKKVAEEIANRF